MTDTAEVGTCPCPLCAGESSVRKFATGRRKGQLYVVCGKHSQFINYGADFQAWILDHMTPLDAEGQRQPPQFVAPPAPAAEPEPVQHVPAPKPPRGPSIFTPVLFAR